MKVEMRLFLIVVFISGGLNVFPQQYSLKQADSLLDLLYKDATTNRDEVIDKCNDLVDFYTSVNDNCKTIKVLVKRADAERNLAKFEEAMSSLIAAQKLQDQSHCNEEFQAFIIRSYSRLYRAIGNRDKADSAALFGIRYFKTVNTNNSLLVELYLEASRGYYKTLDESLPYLDTAMKLAIQYNLSALEQKIMVNTGAAYAYNEKFDEAIKYTRSAMKIAMKRNATEDLCPLYNNLAGMAEDPKETIMYIDSAIYYARLTKNSARLQKYVENKAYFYSITGQHEKGYDELWNAMLLKDSILDIRKIEAIAEMEQKYETEKRSNELQSLNIKMLNTEVENLNYRRNQNRLFIGLFILLVLSGSFAYGYINTKKNKNKLAIKNTEIEAARQLSDELLLNILPAEVAEELKAKGTAEARKYDMVTILFTDFKEFTQTAEKLSATDLVEKINYCFKGFDAIIDKYQIEKIKTIGDAYMAAGGLPAKSDDFVRNTILAALEMQQFIRIRQEELAQTGEPAFEMRVGIHTGPVVAGIVGVKKFQYDVWGDTVNTASRIENHCHIGKVNISSYTYELIKNDPAFTFESRGKITAKGKGEMEMWFVELAG